MDSELIKLLIQTEKALQVFYHDSADGIERDKAHKYLIEIQNSEQAWQLCWKLLDAKKDVETQYFGACMLYHKISMYWRELHPSQYVALKDEIIKYICLYSKNSKLILSKLCMALATLMLNVPSDYILNGVEVSVTELQKSVVSATNDSANVVILEYLTVLPEQFASSPITGIQRTEIREQLHLLIPKVIEMQKDILESPESIATHLVSLKCLTSWIQFGASILDCRTLLPSLLNKLNIEQLAEASSLALVELFSHPASFKHENSIYEFLQHLNGFEAILRKSLANNDSEMVANICKILVSIGETHTNLLRQAMTDDQQKRCLHLVHLILDCTGIQGIYPVDETCSELTFNFWYTFQDELLTVHPDSITNYHFYLRQSFVALIQVLFRKVQLPADEIFQEMSPDEKEMFRCYRQDIQDTIMYVYSLLREQCLQSLAELLAYLLSGEKECRWQEIEAALYLLQGTSEFIDSDEATFIQQIIALVPKLPSHPKVLESAVYMIGSFSEWLACHPEQLSFVLPIFQNGISQNQLTTACTLALRDICRESSRSVSQNMSLDIVETAMDAIRSGKLNDKEQIRCIEIIGYILRNLPVELRKEKQSLFSSFLINMLQSAIKFFQLDGAAQKQVNHWINCFAAYFRSSDSESGISNADSHPLIPCYTHLIKTIETILSNSLTEELCQDIFNVISKAVDTIRDPFYVVLQETSVVISELFAKIPSGTALEVSATIIGMLSNVTSSYTSLNTFFEKLLNESINLFENGKASENPDIIHGFLVLLNRTVKSAPFLFDSKRDLQVKAISIALNSLYCQESSTLKAAINFFTSYIAVAANASSKEITEMLDLFGQDLVYRVLACIGGMVPRTHIEMFADILIAFNRHFVGKVSTWLQNALEQEGFPSTLVSRKEKENFQKTLLREKVNKRKLKEIVRDFSLVCRGLHGLPYTT